MHKQIKKPILITGAGGFIGSNLTRYFVNNNINVNLFLKKETNKWRIKDLLGSTNNYYVNLEDKSKVNETINKIKPKTIFHLATHGAYPFQTNFSKIKKTNLESTINLLMACEKNGFTKFINTGSNSEYGFKNKPMSEDDILVPNSYYAVFKSASTLFCQYEAISKNLPIVTIRPFHVFGPYEEKTRLIPVLITNLLNNNCPPLVSPKISRDFVYIDDVVRFYLYVAINKNISGKILNIGSGKETSIKKIFDLINKIIGKNVRAQWNSMPKRIWDYHHWVADMKKSKKLLNFSNKYKLEDGLKKTIKWYKKNIDII